MKNLMLYQLTKRSTKQSLPNEYNPTKSISRNLNTGCKLLPLKRGKQRFEEIKKNARY